MGEQRVARCLNGRILNGHGVVRIVKLLSLSWLEPYVLTLNSRLPYQQSPVRPIVPVHNIRYVIAALQDWLEYERSDDGDR